MNISPWLVSRTNHGHEGRKCGEPLPFSRSPFSKLVLCLFLKFSSALNAFRSVFSDFEVVWASRNGMDHSALAALTFISLVLIDSSFVCASNPLVDLTLLKEFQN
jgi:hypothetical protein